MPAELPALTMISWVARTEVLAGAISVSLATGSPSAVIETQDVCVARMCSVKVGGASAVTA